MGKVKQVLMAATMDDMSFMETHLGLKIHPYQAEVIKAIKDKKVNIPYYVSRPRGKF